MPTSYDGNDTDSGTTDGAGTDDADDDGDSWLGSVGAWFSNLGDSFMEGLDDVTSSIGGGLADLGSTIGGFVSDSVNGILDGLEYLFVPSVDLGENFKKQINDKFPIIDQLGGLVTRLGTLGANPQAPKFAFTYYGVETSIVNFEDFEDFLPAIKTIIVAIAWTTFIIRLYKRLPSIIGGFR